MQLLRQWRLLMPLLLLLRQWLLLLRLRRRRCWPPLWMRQWLQLLRQW
jgi:hypothetical protein